MPVAFAPISVTVGAYCAFSHLRCSDLDFVISHPTSVTLGCTHAYGIRSAFGTSILMPKVL